MKENGRWVFQSCTSSVVTVSYSRDDGENPVGGKYVQLKVVHIVEVAVSEAPGEISLLILQEVGPSHVDPYAWQVVQQDKDLGYHADGKLHIVLFRLWLLVLDSTHDSFQSKVACVYLVDTDDFQEGEGRAHATEKIGDGGGQVIWHIRCHVLHEYVVAVNCEALWLPDNHFANDV